MKVFAHIGARGGSKGLKNKKYFETKKYSFDKLDYQSGKEK